MIPNFDESTMKWKRIVKDVIKHNFLFLIYSILTLKFDYSKFTPLKTLLERKNDSY